MKKKVKIDELKVDDIKLNDNDNIDNKVKEELSAINIYRSAVKDRSKFMFIYLLLNAIKINEKLLHKVLTDNELNEEKLNLLDKDELKYILKKPFLLGLMKKMPLESLKKIKEHAAKAKKAKQSQTKKEKK